MPHDIFISYSRKDLEILKPIKEELESFGFSCWMDLEGIESGSEEFTEVIVSAIESSSVVLFFLSASSQSSKWSLKELRFAITSKKRTVFIRFNDDALTPAFSFNYGGSDIIDWRVLDQKKKLFRDLRKWTISKEFLENSVLLKEFSSDSTELITQQLVVCPICGKKNHPTDTFRCLNCGRDDLCIRHQDEKTFLCLECASGTGHSLPLNTVHVPGSVRSFRIGSVAFNLCYCPAGSFVMGSPSFEEGHQEDERQHMVKLTSGFWMGETQVTQALWIEVMGNNPSVHKGDNLPVGNVSWDECNRFVMKLGARLGVPFQLPTESQWEYACRAGLTGIFGADSIDDYGWYSENSDNQLHPVKTKRPNTWNIYDMIGNVNEWCADWYAPYPSVDCTNPTGPDTGTEKIGRGGGAWSARLRCRAALRNHSKPDFRYHLIGLRICLPE